MKQDTRTFENGWITEKYLTKDLKVKYICINSYVQCRIELDIEECTYYGFASDENKEKAYIAALKKVDEELKNPTTYRETDNSIDFGNVEKWEAELEYVKKCTAIAKRKQEVAKYFLSIIHT